MCVRCLWCHMVNLFEEKRNVSIDSKISLSQHNETFTPVTINCDIRSRFSFRLELFIPYQVGTITMSSLHVFTRYRKVINKEKKLYITVCSRARIPRFAFRCKSANLFTSPAERKRFITGTGVDNRNIQYHRREAIWKKLPLSESSSESGGIARSSLDFWPIDSSKCSARE